MLRERLVLLMLKARACWGAAGENGGDRHMASLQAHRGKKKGADSALWLSTVAFTACFAVWTIFSIIGVQIQRDLGLSETQFGLLIGTPILTGSLIRLVLGVWTEQYGGRVVNLVVMLAAAAATYLLSYAHTYEQFLLAALGVGIAGGSFAVGIAYVSKFYPTSEQGTALGIFGAGNVGAAVTKFAAPIVMAAMGWKGVAQRLGHWARCCGCDFLCVHER
jgi:NNP family nitrate/nitrite transporter-like MFS transporter